ncbi:MAG: hypothetical protein DRO67_06780 [Candidatus Asgardarchaeum californiense]|nr:MAG: hypothetical protein DRO67_06780 [Candidatus Asgardarchaeum californiense]
MAAKKNGLSITIAPEEIIGSEINRSGEYRYASIGVKKGDNQFMRISYEWKGDAAIPEFVMGIMGWISSAENKEVVDISIKEHAEEYAALKERM